jgi:hypothetical protein
VIYFIGNDPNRWRTNISTFAKVQYLAGRYLDALAWLGTPSA